MLRTRQFPFNHYGNTSFWWKRSLHPYLRRFDQAVLEGQGVFRACMKLRAEGWEPDCVITRIGFGNGLYIRDACPNVRKIGFFEWYYNSFDSDVDF